jgi:hypothetical protein
MWATYNYASLPLVCVDFTDNIKNIEDYNNFIQKWTELYADKKDFYFLFDTTNTAMVNIKYSYKMSKFISKLKEFPYQYLQQSVIIVKNRYIKFLLNIIFMFQKPVAPVYMINYKDNKDLCGILRETTQIDEINRLISLNRKSFTLISAN